MKKQKLLLLIAVLFSAFANASNVPNCTAETEPNNTSATSNVLNLGLQNVTMVCGAISPGGDFDFFQVNDIVPGSKIWLVNDPGGIQNAGSTSRDLVLEVFAADGTTVLEADDDDGTGNGGDGSTETGLAASIGGLTLTTGGTYFIKLKAFSGTAIVDPYKLFITVTNTSAISETEANNLPATANPIATSLLGKGFYSGSIGIAGDEDYYSVSAQSGNILVIDADADPERDGTGTDLVVEVLDASNVLLLNFDGSGSGSLSNPVSESANYIITSTGTYYIKVKHFSASGTGTYNLMAALAASTMSLTSATCGSPETFSDGSGAFDYANNTNLSWLINPSVAHNTVTLTFTTFATETGFDTVAVYDGPNASSPQVAGSPFSGASLPSVIHSTGGSLFVVFKSDGNVTKPGWSANYIPNVTPSVSISGNTTICRHETASFTATPTNGGSPNYQWKVNGISVGTNSPNYSTDTLTNGAVVTCVMTSNAPCAYPTSVTSNALTMTVHPLPTVGITSIPAPPVVCDGDYVTLSGTGATSYSWDNGITDGVAFQQAVGTETYTVIGTDANGCTNTASIDVTVNALPTPVITSNTGSFIFCNHSSIILDAGTYDAYQWSTGATTQSIATNSGATYTVTVTDGNGCTASTSETTVRINSVPARPGTISGPVYGLCNTSGNAYSISPVANASSYIWTVTNGIITSGQGTTDITVDYFGFTSSTIKVKAVNACGSSSSRSITVYAKPAAPLTINGNKNGVCKVSGEMYTIDPVDGATNYKWTVPSGVTIVSGQGTTDLTVNFSSSFVSGNICCRAENACGNSAYTCMTVKAKPQKPVTIFGPTGVCHNSTGNVYWTPAVYGATTYIWDVPHGAIITSGQGTPTIEVTFGHHSGEVEVWASNSCGTSGDYDLDVHIVCREANTFATGEVNAYPNPVHDNLNVSITSELNQKCSIRMIDIIGKQMMFDAIELVEGENLHQYDVSGFAKGLYFIVIEREGMPAQTLRVVVE